VEVAQSGAAAGDDRHHHHPTSEAEAAMSVYERVARMASGNAVVVFRASGCCMCHVVKRLLLGLGVGPTVYELDQMVVGFGSGCGGREIQAALAQLLPLGQPPVPVVFVGEVPGAITGAAAPPPSTVSTSTVLPLPPRHCRRRRRLAGCWSIRIWFSEEAQKRKGGRAGARAACSAGFCLDFFYFLILKSKILKITHSNYICKN
jgi:glutaredoxin 3